MNNKIVTIGGGTGQSRLLSYLKKYPLDITAVVSMIDNGGSTGEIRKQYKVLPCGDIRRCLVALAEQEPVIQNIMDYRFKDGFLENHNFGNLLMLALEKELGSFEKMIEYFHRLFKIKGQVLPVTLQATDLVAELENGLKVYGETNIDIPQHNPNLKIKKVFLLKKVKANPKVLAAIKRADLIVYTIGDLFTSIVPNLLISGITEAIQKSKAKKVYTCNRTTKKGETHGFNAQNFVDTLKQYLGKNSLDYILVDSNKGKSTKQYELVDSRSIKGVKVLRKDLSVPLDRAHVDSKKLAKELFVLCQKK